MGINLDERQLERFDLLTEVLLDWNSRMNLTRITDRVEIAEKHYLDSIALLQYIDLPKGAAVIDVGTGAGIPGLPLKIMRPEIRLSLLDSVGKKLSFAEAAAANLELEKVRILHARAEDAGRDRAYRGQFDLSVSRAVARLTTLLELCLPFCKVGGRFAAYKGPDVDLEIAEVGKALSLLGGKIEAVHRFTLPHSDSQRTIVIVKKTERTQTGYPRKAGIPSREPIL